ncbi:uncharacterized protein LOC142636591 [Castanea sativa]|uniref:uncharacterized protein LOC142636591 n=1 Tax=Castanea sativa TaxID=21020 RepID=UPI003F652BD2
MDVESDSDEEIDKLREGFTAINLSTETKLRIRASGSRAIIIKTLAQKDLEAVLNKGPWFIEEHFLSICIWEANFKPLEAVVTSVAVWVHLNELPIEYYDAGVLGQIGQALGNVLRVDTHTAMEARGKYTHIYIQVDIDRPLVMTVCISKRHQNVVCEGHHKLCFLCGRIGHRKENCQYTIRPPSPLPNVNNTEKIINKEAQASPPLEVQDIDSLDAAFGPWMVVSQRRKRPKGVQKSNTNLTPDLHHAFKHASMIESLETNTSDRLPVGSKSTDGKRKARNELDLRVESEPNTLGNSVSGLMGSGFSELTQTIFKLGLPRNLIKA